MVRQKIRVRPSLLALLKTSTPIKEDFAPVSAPAPEPVEL